MHAWVLRVESTGSSISQVYEISVPVGVSTDKRVTYVNRSQTWAVFHFRSSHPAVLELPEPRLALEGGAKGYLVVRVHPVTVPGQAEVCVFAADSEENSFEVILFKLKYD